MKCGAGGGANMAALDKFKSPRAGGSARTLVRPKSESKPPKARAPALNGSASVGKLPKKKLIGSDAKPRRASEGTGKNRASISKFNASALDASSEEAGEDEDPGEEREDSEEEVEDPALPDHEVDAVVEVDGKELVKVLKELRESVADVRVEIQRAKAKIEDGRMPTANGVTYLEVKLQLLLSYCASLALYLSLKTRGESIIDHPVIDKLVEVRTYLVAPSLATSSSRAAPLSLTTSPRRCPPSPNPPPPRATRKSCDRSTQNSSTRSTSCSRRRSQARRARALRRLRRTPCASSACPAAPPAGRLSRRVAWRPAKLDIACLLLHVAPPTPRSRLT